MVLDSMFRRFPYFFSIYVGKMAIMRREICHLYLL